MVEREKVIKALEKCSFRDCPTCPYYSPNDSRCIRELIYDALTLLKEQEPVKPKKDYYINDLNIPMDIYYCGACGRKVNGKYCSSCGKAVKWDEID